MKWDFDRVWNEAHAHRLIRAIVLRASNDILIKSETDLDFTRVAQLRGVYEAPLRCS